MTDEQLFTQARDVNFTFKTALADVQMQIFDGEWKITDYGAQGYSGDIANIVIQAKKPDAYVDRLMIDISPDPDTYDIATITAESTCESGDLERLDAIRRPGVDSEEEDLELVPSTEHPTAKPSFGYTPEGKRRFWDDSDSDSE